MSKKEQKIIDFRSKTLVFVDVETTGLMADKHEIIEIGSIIVDGRTLEKKAEFHRKIIPVKLHSADHYALSVNGYNSDDWLSAESAVKVLEEFNEISNGGIAIGWNVAFDWRFIEHGFSRNGIKSLLDYQRLDVMSMAYSKLYKKGEVTSLKLKSVAQYYGIRVQDGFHGAREDIEATYEIFKRLVGI